MTKKPIPEKTPTPPQGVEQVSPPEQDLGSYLDANASELKEIVIPRNTVLNPKQAEEVIANFMTKHNLTKNQAKVVIASLFQSGGTSKSCDGNLEVSAFNKKIKLASLRKSLAECKVKGCERKLARALADEIALISKKLGLPGNLAIKAQNLKNTELIPLEIQIWLSDFQEKNPNCPDQARKLIAEVFLQRKPTTTKKK